MVTLLCVVGGRLGLSKCGGRLMERVMGLCGIEVYSGDMCNVIM